MFPLCFTRPAIRRFGSFVLFTLVFGVLFTLRAEQAIGARIEHPKLRIHYPYPTKDAVVPLATLPTPRLRETSSVTILEFPDTPYRFVPASHLGSDGQQRLHALFDAITQNIPSDA